MDRPLLVLYGSQTGNAQEVADRIVREARRLHFTNVNSMAMDEGHDRVGGTDFGPQRRVAVESTYGADEELTKITPSNHDLVRMAHAKAGPIRMLYNRARRRTR